MSTCDQLRAAIVEAKTRRNDAQRTNAAAENAGERAPFSEADVQALRLAVEVAALEARRAGCHVDDLVGPNVGNLDQ